MDCVTQREIVATCERLSETYLLPVIKAMQQASLHDQRSFPRRQHQVAGRLKNPRIELAKSRRRQWNDNGLERARTAPWCRNCSQQPRPHRYAMQINAFCAAYLNPYLNFPATTACSPTRLKIKVK